MPLSQNFKKFAIG